MDDQKNTGRPDQANDADANRENDPLPGYPHYPPREDILDPRNDFEKADVDVENFSRATWTAARDEAVSHLGEEKLPGTSPDELAANPLVEDEDTAIVMGTEADVTEDDLILLGDPDLDQDGGDDELLDNYQGLDDTDFDGEPLNEFAGTLAGTGEDLDIPDVEGSRSRDAMDQGDEENDYYSLGGDEKDSLEDDQAGVNF
jgi:hypothetical protein